MKNETPKFYQFYRFAWEILHIIDEGKKLSVEQVCNEIEKGTIVEFIENEFSFSNMYTKEPRAVSDVNAMLQRMYVSDGESSKNGINNNGLLYILHLIFEQLNQTLFNLKLHDVDPDEFRHHLDED